MLIGALEAGGTKMVLAIYDENGNVDMDASRRVEFKFSLKDAEMIDQMSEILEGQQGD